MSRSLLYYPSFLPPSREWAQNTLLFWDDFATIVPSEYEHEIQEDYMVELRGLGLYHPVDPRRILERSWQQAEQLVEDLRNRLQSFEVEQEIVACPADEVYYISVAKATYGAAEVLRDFKYRADPRDETFFIDDWLPVKKPVALVYMSLLAELVAASERMQPSTDQQSFEEAMFSDTPWWAPGTPNGRATVRLVLEDALPKIRPDATFEQIVAFRNQHPEELLAFRTVLGDLQRSLSSANTVSDSAEVVQSFKERVQLATLRYDRMLETERLKGITGTFSALFSINTPQVVGALIGAGVASPLGPEAALMTASLGFFGGGCMKIAERFVAAKESRDRRIDLPLSYVFQATRSIGR